MVYTNGDGTYHEDSTCRRLHNTGGRIRFVEDADDRDACDHCVDEERSEMQSRDVAQLIEVGVCPWCPVEDRYEGDHVGQHASSAHPDEWAEYKAD
jgi:hypothetical protein